MKLRTRLTIYSIALIVAAIIACCALIISFTWEKALDDAAQAALGDIAAFDGSFRLSIYGDMPSDLAVRRSFLVQRMRSVPGSGEFTLLCGREYLSDNLGFAPETLIGGGSLSEDGLTRYRTVKLGNTDCLIAQRYITLQYPDEYSLCLVRDISPLTAGVRALAVKCAAAGITVIAAAAAFMWFIVFRALRPVEKLKAGAAALSMGNYEKRIDLPGKDELSELAADFNVMAEAIEANIKELNERARRQQAFINDLSHEMKTPVTSILLNAETLLSRKVPPDALARSLERIYDQGRWLERLSRKLMALVMLQSDIPLRPESVGKLLEAAAGSTADALREKDIKLITDCGMDTLPMDFDLMRSALVNLVENAGRASSPGQSVTLRAYRDRIEISDRGRGIPKEDLARVTEPFYMVDRSRSKKLGGSGLGLAMVKGIAAAHNAEFSIISEPGKGTTAAIIFKKSK